MIVFGRRRADPGHAEVHHLDQRIERPDPAGRLDLDVRRACLAASGAGRRGSRPPAANPVEVLTKSAPAASVSVAGPDLLVVGQVGVLEDHLDDRARRRGRPRRPPRCRPATSRVAAGLQGADVDDHVDLGRAVGERPARLGDLGRRSSSCRAGSRRPSRPRRRSRPGSRRARADVDRPDADRRDVVLARRAGSRPRRTRRRARAGAASGRSSWRSSRSVRVVDGEGHALT